MELAMTQSIGVNSRLFKTDSIQLQRRDKARKKTITMAIKQVMAKVFSTQCKNVTRTVKIHSKNAYGRFCVNTSIRSTCHTFKGVPLGMVSWMTTERSRICYQILLKISWIGIIRMEWWMILAPLSIGNRSQLKTILVQELEAKEI